MLQRDRSSMALGKSNIVREVPKRPKREEDLERDAESGDGRETGTRRDVSGG